MENNVLNRRIQDSNKLEYKDDTRDHTYEIDYNDQDVLAIMQRFDSLMRDAKVSLLNII